MKFVTIVEGHGEVQAVPVLLRRLAEERDTTVSVPRPIRIPRGKLVKRDELQRAVHLAAKYATADDPILVILDSEGGCPAELGPQLLQWARSARPDRRIAVVVAKNEFEAWFLAAAASLVATGRLPVGTVPPSDPEGIRDAKGWLGQRMGRRYSETIDQPAFAALIDLEAAQRCGSFEKLVREVDRLLAAP